MKYFTSDLHFGHKNVIKYCNRPYKSVEEMDKVIIETWNQQVSDSDSVYFMGDFGINKNKCLDSGLVRQLNGKKYMILGNHDSNYNRLMQNPENVKIHANICKKYLEAGWCFVDTRHYLMLKNDLHVVLTHLPPDNSIDSRYSDYKLKNNPNFIYIHGHLHGRYVKFNNMIDVGFDSNLTLYTEDDIINLVQDNRQYIPSRLTKYYLKKEAERAFNKIYRHN